LSVADKIFLRAHPIAANDRFRAEEYPTKLDDFKDNQQKEEKQTFGGGNGKS
jgi:hypothetical protein